MENKTKIGMWATYCCAEDMFLIETQDQIDEIIESFDDEIPCKLAESEQEAREKWTVN